MYCYVNKKQLTELSVILKTAGKLKNINFGVFYNYKIIVLPLSLYVFPIFFL